MGCGGHQAAALAQRVNDDGQAFQMFMPPNSGKLVGIGAVALHRVQDVCRSAMPWATQLLKSSTP